jgi:hypothetical protein
VVSFLRFAVLIVMLRIALAVRCWPSPSANAARGVSLLSASAAAAVVHSGPPLFIG